MPPPIELLRLEVAVAEVLCEEQPGLDVPFVQVRDSRLGLALASCA